MSQPSTPFNGSATDPFLPLMDQEQQSSQADFEILFRSGGSYQPFFSSNSSDVLDEFDYTYDNASASHVNSSNPSAISTPNFSSYGFGLQSEAYPNPGPNLSHPYPLGLQLGNHTNNIFARPAPPPQQYTRRRSLSHSDVGRVTTSNCIPNPTFIRLQAPRTRSSTPEEKRRSSPYPQHGRSASQGPGTSTRGRPMKHSSTPYALQNSPLVGGMLPTPIGTPLNELTEVEDLRYGTDSANFSRQIKQPIQYNSNNDTNYEDPVVIRHMNRPEELVRSRHIIEIGAMAVTQKVDPRLLDDEHNMSLDSYHTTRILGKLEDIEKHLRCSVDGNDAMADALRGCAMIREALEKKRMQEGIEDGEEYSLDAVSNMLDEREYGVCDVNDALTTMLERATARADEGFVGER